MSVDVTRGRGEGLPEGIKSLEVMPVECITGRVVKMEEEKEQRPEEYDPDWWEEPPRETPMATRSTRGYPRLRGAPAGERRMPRSETVPSAERPPPKKPGQWARGGGQEAQKKTEEPPLPPHQRGGAVRYVDWTNCPRCNFGFSPDQEKLRACTTEASKPPRQ